MISFNFLVTSLIVVLVPGTGVVYTISTGLSQGKRASIYAALGCTLGILLHLAATVLGLSALMHTSALAFQSLKIVGVLYLFYLAYGMWRDTSAFSVSDSPADSSRRELVSKAFLINILNPKLTIFFLAFLPQFVSQDGGAPSLHMLLLSAVFMAMTFAVFVAYGMLADLFRRAIIESARVQRWLRRSFATAFAGLALDLALTDHS